MVKIFRIRYITRKILKEFFWNTLYLNILSWSVGDHCSWKWLWCWKRFPEERVHRQIVRKISVRCQTSTTEEPENCWNYFVTRGHPNGFAWVFAQLFHSRRHSGLPCLLQHRVQWCSATHQGSTISSSIMQRSNTNSTNYCNTRNTRYSCLAEKDNFVH